MPQPKDKSKDVRMKSRLGQGRRGGEEFGAVVPTATEGLTVSPAAGRPSVDAAYFDHRASVARSALLAGGTFATAISAILGTAGVWGFGDRTVLCALVALCAIAGLTMFTAARVLR
jgi:hypothetical protein